ncbi:MAG TPA: 1-acyl-sn-glycerol-3-phosphate acyltransferase [Deltaproteobacteria bacterium]|nr:1-acyl-sn-glycerol-3-phosphate acyltransferase [Deltaproteobacteria bacterium]HOI07982.1 1-acyl-sn-glycerol-3-phosphate acyltransferase [Deltaproteobacteria bacterium]
MITDILYRCPNCGSFDWLDREHCRHCGTGVRIISRSRIEVGGTENTVSHWYQKVLSFELPANGGDAILTSGPVELSREAHKGTYKGYSGVVARRYTRLPFDEGGLVLKRNGLVFSGRNESFAIPLGDVTAITIESDTIIVISRTLGVLFFDFLEESGKKWEDMIRKVLTVHHAPREIVEFYPRLRFEDSFREFPARATGHKDLVMPVKRWFSSNTSLLFTVVRALAKPVVEKLFSVDIRGLENIPKTGAALLLSNHTSFMDSIILGTFPRRRIWFMAKNSEYRNPLMTWAMIKARSFPVRRYTIDVAAVRNAIRVVQQGHILGIYPEGERCWDNSLLPLRFGTMRLALALGKPIIPVGISGAYELMPRWESSLKPSTVRIRIGEPFELPHIPGPKQTKDHVFQARDTVRTRITNLLGEIN